MSLAEAHRDGTPTKVWREAMRFGRRQRRQSLPLGDTTRLQAIEEPCSAIESGRYGDLIAVTGDPLKDMSVLEHVDFAMNRGEVEQANR